ncbi:hypothetical protein AB0F18_10145 [Streptomyces sp. NPDC029216]|uniref:hypothetical protein n=1 Tax=Streptomyces sp. NPDC029216 TaxID=3154701 RepID=UPI0033EC59BA
MSTPTRAETQISIALESIQGKRRIERVMEAANALLDRYATKFDPEERLTLGYELIRRNFTGEISIVYGDLALGTDADHQGETTFHCELLGPEGRTGTLTAHYTEPGSLGLTSSEWLAAMRLLAGISGLGIGGHAVCPA